MISNFRAESLHVNPQNTVRARSACWSVVVLCLALACFEAKAAGVNFTRSIEQGYVAGQTLDISVTITLESAGSFTGLGLEETLPPGWTFVQVLEGAQPTVAPSTPVSFLEFLWDPAPAEITFSYQVRVAPNETQIRNLTGRVLYRLSGVPGEQQTAVLHTPVLPLGGAPGFHSADRDQNLVISLSELLRVLQFFNIGSLHCAASPDATEDGYVAGSGETQLCFPHDSDFVSQDWVISLSELLRMVQFYNSESYYYCPDDETEDGYCRIDR